MTKGRDIRLTMGGYYESRKMVRDWSMIWRSIYSVNSYKILETKEEI